MRSSSPPLPAGPLLRAYLDAGLPSADELGELPELGPRFRAVLAAPGEFLSRSYIDRAAESEYQAALGRFYEACVPHALHAPTLLRRAGVVRHALGHLLRCPDPLPQKAERFLAPDGPYYVAGLGPCFWSALFQALDPLNHPAWTPAVEAGLRRLGLARRRPQDGPERVYAALLNAYRRLRAAAPGMTALHLDHFLTLVGAMPGRNLFAGPEAKVRTAPDVISAIQQERGRVPLRERLKERGQELHEARKSLEASLSVQDGARIGAALAVADPAGFRRTSLDWPARSEDLTLWVGRLWEADDPYALLESYWRADPFPGAGLWLPVAVLHLKDPRHFFPWDDASRRGYAPLDDAADRGGTAAERYRLFNEGVARLRERHRLHPLEAPTVLAALAADARAAEKNGAGPAPFGGFCADTFRFLGELGRNNRRDWMERQRDRYRFAVRDPLVELCRELAGRYVEPVLRREWGWELETEARSGRALTSVCKNDYGRSVPYHTELWITFYRRGAPGDANPGRRGEAQFFVRLSAAGLCYGLLVGRGAREAGPKFCGRVQEQAGPLFDALAESGALAECRFGTGFDEAGPGPADGRLTGLEDLRSWAGHALKVRRRAGEDDDLRLATPLVVAKTVPAGAPLLASDDLVGDILLTFDRLLPLYACAREAGPLPVLERRGKVPAAGRRFAEADFCRATYLSADWLERARSLLDLKRQLILQGVPGTGKTHVAHCLARLLTGGREEAVRLVQFHPAYSYEEFVEGIKVRSVEVDGRHDVTYPVEDGLLCAFAAEAARHPAEPYVLVIDEINRGNLPRVFGELLYLLEYRERTVRLPYSRRGFGLPANLVLLGTMNAADRSVALVDQALRRRFSFLDMPPDAGVLAAWLRAHPPQAGAAFADTVVALFERLNARLKADLGPACQVGQSYFMVPNLNEARLRVVWEHQVAPLLEEYAAGRPNRAPYDLDALLDGQPRRQRQPAGV